MAACSYSQVYMLYINIINPVMRKGEVGVAAMGGGSMDPSRSVSVHVYFNASDDLPGEL